MWFASETCALPHDWGRFLPEHTTTARHLDRLLHHAIVTDGDPYRMRTRGGGVPTPNPHPTKLRFSLATSGDFHPAIDTGSFHRTVKSWTPREWPPRAGCGAGQAIRYSV